ncbi:MAG TPA: hypothetical protein VGB41_06385 [Acidimicrobiia bacterium]
MVMSAWGIGVDARRPEARADKTLKDFFGHLTAWIPGDVLGFYAAALAAISTDKGLSDATLLWIWIAAGLGLTPLLVVAGAWKQGNDWPAKLGWKALVAVVAFGVWSLVLPSSGWSALFDGLRDNPGIAATITAGGGLMLTAFTMIIGLSPRD